MSTKAQKKAKQKQEGFCKLTGENGKFVNAHILPKALTKLSSSGEKVRETALGVRPQSRPATWYDNQLVIREGEDILEEIDTLGIDTLREHKLVWSSFKVDDPFTPEDLIPFNENIYLRELNAGSAEELRLFFLSIVWRAAASSRPEFADIQLSNEILEDLRQRVESKNCGDIWDYPVILDQLITRGPPQNRTPIIENFSIAVKGAEDLTSVMSVRIYMDGLVAKVILAKGIEIDREKVGNIFLGASDSSFIFARKFEQSRTLNNMLEVIADNVRRGYA